MTMMVPRRPAQRHSASRAVAAVSADLVDELQQALPGPGHAVDLTVMRPGVGGALGGTFTLRLETEEAPVPANRSGEACTGGVRAGHVLAPTSTSN